MANGTKKPTALPQPWFPANDIEAEKAASGEVYQAVDGQLYQHQDMPKASPKNPPEPVAPDAPAPEVQTSAPSPHATPPATSESGPTVPGPRGDNAPLDSGINVPASIENSASFRKAIPGGPTNPSYDSDKFDSTGENEKQEGPPGPRGVNRPGDVMSDAERKQVADKRDRDLAKGMSSTDAIDSTGMPKGHFAIEPQGHDKHGARQPDKVDYEEPLESHPVMVGPRGVGAPADTFHKK